MASRPGLSPTTLYPVLDWFIPPNLKSSSETRQRARMFLLSHLFGPFLGHTITIYLYWLDPHPGYGLWVLAASITAFWVFPFLLRATGWYTLLALLSIQNLTFAILWGCYHYGGVSSPFLPWLLTIPLLAFFYLGPAARLRHFVLVLIGVNFIVFYTVFVRGHDFPNHVPLAALAGIGIISTICAAIYVTMMALYYASIVASQSDLELEVRNHLETAVKLREAKDKAERANEAKTAFLAKMSHELRTPLNAVIGYSEMLLEEIEPGGHEQQRADLVKINGAGHGLLGLVNDILDLSKIDAGKMELFIEQLDLRKLVDEVCAGCAESVAKNGNTLAVEGCGAGEMIESDAAKLRQVLRNLLDNAAKFTRNGTITLTVQHESDWVTLVVQDTGSGISPQNLRNLFQTFHEGEGETATKYGGTGLGLALSQKLSRLMGGEITVQSTLGHGSCFTVRVPAKLKAMRGPKSDAEAARSSATREGASRKTVLAIDDDPEIREYVRRVVSDSGYQPLLAANASDGMRLAREAKPAAIILDVVMPAMDGWELLRRLKEDSALAACPVIMLTGSDNPVKGWALGAADCLIKPLDREALARVLRTHAPLEPGGAELGERRQTAALAAAGGGAAA